MCLYTSKKKKEFVYSPYVLFHTGNTELSDDMCKEYEVMYSSCETTRNSIGIEESTDGMILGPEDLSYQIYDDPGKL